MKRKNKVVFNIFNIFLLVILCAFSFVSPFVFRVANAVENSDYSNVLEDLSLDENFNVEDYPSKEKDYSIDIIQVAETQGGEVIIYAYQPSAEYLQLIATKVSLSTTILNNYSPELYNLTLLNSEGVFQKYRVDGLSVKADVVRYYEISEIFRTFNADIDKEPVGGNTTSEVAFPVAQRWTACTLDGSVYYDCVVTDVVEIKDMFVGFVEYEDGFKLFGGNDDACQSHFVAFSTDHDIDTLLEADIEFTHQSRAYDLQGVTEPLFGSEITEKLTLYSSDEVEYTTQGTFTHTKYEWNRIETPTEFFNSVETNTIYKFGLFNITDKRVIEEEDKNIINDMQYVLRFYESPFTIEQKRISLNPFVGSSMLIDYVNETVVTDVVILRLKFVYEGKIYNLGVVGDIQSGNGESSSYEEWSAEVGDWVKTILFILGGVLILILILVVLQLCGVLKPVLKFIGECLLKVVKAIWWVISSPFVALKSLIKKE